MDGLLVRETLPDRRRGERNRLLRIVPVGRGHQQELPAGLQPVLVARVQALAQGCGAHCLQHCRAVLDDCDMGEIAGFPAWPQGGELIVARVSQVQVVQAALEDGIVLRCHVGAPERLRARYQRVDLAVPQHEVPGQAVGLLAGGHLAGVFATDLEHLGAVSLGHGCPCEQRDEQDSYGRSEGHIGLPPRKPGGQYRPRRHSQCSEAARTWQFAPRAAMAGFAGIAFALRHRKRALPFADRSLPAVS